MKQQAQQNNTTKESHNKTVTESSVEGNASDDDWLLDAIKSKRPVKWLIDNFFPKDRRSAWWSARNLLLNMATRYPELNIEEVMKHERQSDYNEIVPQYKLNNLAFIKRHFSNKYNISVPYAEGYVIELIEEFGPIEKAPIEKAPIGKERSAMDILLSDVYAAGYEKGYRWAIDLLSSINCSFEQEKREYFKANESNLLERLIDILQNERKP